MSSRIVMISPEGKDSYAASISWCEKNGLNPVAIRVPTFVDLETRKIYAIHVVSNAEGWAAPIPHSLDGRKFGLSLSAESMEHGFILSALVEHPLLVDPPESIVV